MDYNCSVANGVLLGSIVQLRLAIQHARDLRLRGELREIEVGLRRQVGAAVPKRVAAGLLGISVTALVRWIDRGCLPAVASAHGSSRLAVETGPLLDLATTVSRLRRAGETRGVISKAVRELGWRDRGRRLVLRYEIACLPRPNISLDELQRHYRGTTPQERVLEMAALHRSVNALRSRARR